jgi:hypothetical protein
VYIIYVKILRKVFIQIDRIILNGKLRQGYFSTLANISLRKLKSEAGFQYTVYTERRTSGLTALSEKYGSDKGSNLSHNPYPWRPHTYTQYYDLLFSRQRSTILRVFECGIGSADESIISNMSATGATGASLRMWRDYFPNAIIFGGDIDSKTNSLSIQNFWKNAGNELFDVMIDDGLHSFGAGKTLFENSIHRLKASGLYIIEDVNVFDLIRYREYFDSLDFDVNYVTLYFGKNVISDDCLITIKQRQ